MKRPPRREPVDDLLDRLALDDRDGPALPLDDQRALSLVRQARERLAPVPRGRLLRFPKLPLIGVGVVVATSAAAAALGGFPRLVAFVSDIAAPAEVRETSAPSKPRQRDERGAKPGPTLPADTPPTDVEASPESVSAGIPSDPVPLPAASAPLVEPAAPSEPARSNEATAALVHPVEPLAPEAAERSQRPERTVRVDRSARAERAARAELAMPRESSARAPLAEPGESVRVEADDNPTPPSPPARAATAHSGVRDPRSHGTLAPELALEPVASPDSAPAADLLGLANRARAERRFDAAIKAYRRVIASFPNTRQAQIARVSAGDLELERGDPRAAELLFYGAVRDADVGAEALFGLAEAYRAESRVVEERRALVLFERRHPSNPLAPAARRRLADIGEVHAPN